MRKVKSDQDEEAVGVDKWALTVDVLPRYLA